VRRRRVLFLGFLSGLFAATAFVRRGAARRRDRADLYFADGSMISLAPDSGDAQRLLPVARELIRAARGA
jgi:hypothetical protein